MIISEHWRRCRVYFNKRDDPAGKWSVDQGPGTQEYKFESINFSAISYHGVNQPPIRFGGTQLDLENKDLENEAIAWIELIGVKVSGTVGGKLVIEV